MSLRTLSSTTTQYAHQYALIHNKKEFVDFQQSIRSSAISHIHPTNTHTRQHVFSTGLLLPSSSVSQSNHQSISAIGSVLHNSQGRLYTNLFTSRLYDLSYSHESDCASSTLRRIQLAVYTCMHNVAINVSRVVRYMDRPSQLIIKLGSIQTK